MEKHSNKKQGNTQNVSKGYLERQVEQMYHLDNEFSYDLGPTQPLDKKSTRDYKSQKQTQSHVTKHTNRK